MWPAGVVMKFAVLRSRKVLAVPPVVVALSHKENPRRDSRTEPCRRYGTPTMGMTLSADRFATIGIQSRPLPLLGKAWVDSACPVERRLPVSLRQVAIRLRVPQRR